MNNFKQFIQDIKKKISISDVIEKFIPVKKISNNFIATCPFHNDKTPSLSISNELGIFKCFACHESGDAIAFVEKFNSTTFIDALRTICEIFNIEMPKANPQAQSTYALLNKIADIFHGALLRETEHVKYLTDNRSVSYDTIKALKIGYVNITTKQLLEKIGHNHAKDLHEIKIINNSQYTLFHKRIVFPIYNSIGDVVGFSGRTTINSPRKYVNSVNSNIFNKSKIIYNLNNTKHKDQVCIVEGCMDVAALHSSGVDAVSFLGTGCSEHQIKSTYTYIKKKIVFMFDGDTSGRDACYRISAKFLKYLDHSHELMIAQMPDNVDPNDYINKHGEIDSVINNSHTLFDVIYDKYLSEIQAPQTSLSKKAQAKENIINVFQGIDNKVVRSIYISEYYKKERGKRYKPQETTQRIVYVNDYLENVEFLVVYGIIMNPEIIDDIEDEIWNMVVVRKELHDTLEQIKNIIAENSAGNNSDNTSDKSQSEEYKELMQNKISINKDIFEKIKYIKPNMFGSDKSDVIKNWKYHYNNLTKARVYEEMKKMCDEYVQTQNEDLVQKIQALKNLLKYS